MEWKCFCQLWWRICDAQPDWVERRSPLAAGSWSCCSSAAFAVVGLSRNSDMARVGLCRWSQLGRLVAVASIWIRHKGTRCLELAVVTVSYAMAHCGGAGKLIIIFQALKSSPILPLADTPTDNNCARCWDSNKTCTVWVVERGYLSMQPELHRRSSCSTSLLTASFSAPMS